jgi:hypothetical protein
MSRQHTLVSMVAAVALAACGQPAEEQMLRSESSGVAVNCPAADDSGNIEIAPGLTARIIKTGYGRSAVTGDYADTNVWLWQFDEMAENRHGLFIWESGDTVFQFQLGSGQVIKGWDMGVPCMLEGETRELVIAPDLAYGAAGRGATIPPNTTLIFTIELVKLTASG